MPIGADMRSFQASSISTSHRLDMETFIASLLRVMLSRLGNSCERAVSGVARTVSIPERLFLDDPYSGEGSSCRIVGRAVAGSLPTGQLAQPEPGSRRGLRPRDAPKLDQGLD